MQTLLLVIELLIAVALIGVVLLQRSEGGALGMGGGGGGGGGFGGLFSPRGAGDVLTRTTSILAVAFFVVCILLSLLVRYSHKPQSILDSATPATKVEQPVKKVPAKTPTPQVPM